MTDAAGWYNRVRRLVVRALATDPVLGLVSARAHFGRPVTVLCYHTLGSDTGNTCAWTVRRMRDFRADLVDLAQRYRIVSLDDALAAGPGISGRPLAVITFDDGEAGLYRHLLPFLSDAQIPITLYVATEQIEIGRPYWFDRVLTALGGSGAAEIDLGLLGCFLITGTDLTRWAAVSAVLEAIKTADPAARDLLADQVEAQAPASPGTPLAPMTRDALAELAASPWVTIGGHSHCHHLLDQIPLVEAAASLRRCRYLLRDWTGQEVVHLAWPNGNWTSALADAARDAGFHSATALGQQLWRADADAYALPRIAIGRYDSPARVRLMLAEI